MGARFSLDGGGSSSGEDGDDGAVSGDGTERGESIVGLENLVGACFLR